MILTHYTIYLTNAVIKSVSEKNSYVVLMRSRQHVSVSQMSQEMAQDSLFKICGNNCFQMKNLHHIRALADPMQPMATALLPTLEGQLYLRVIPLTKICLTLVPFQMHTSTVSEN